jgi:hypothetical protein
VSSQRANLLNRVLGLGTECLVFQGLPLSYLFKTYELPMGAPVTQVANLAQLPDGRLYCVVSE